MITAAQWVPRGFAAPFPQKYELDEQEYERIAELAKLQLEDAQEDLEEAEGQNGTANGDKSAAEDEDMGEKSGKSTDKPE
jgi:periodic tryptophan protein 1